MMEKSESNVLRLLTDYTFNIDLDASNMNLICIICKKLMIDAYQTYCGCQYCYLCIADYLSGGAKYCYGDKDECKDEYLVLDKNVLKNAMLNRQILKVKVICPLEACKYSSNLLQMEEHLRTCSKQSIECPYLSIGCDTEMSKKDTILTHLKQEKLSHSKLLIDLMYNLRNEVEILKKSVKESKLSQIEDSCMNKIKFEELQGEIEYLKGESENKHNRIIMFEEEAKKKDEKIYSLEKELKEAHNSDRKIIEKLQKTVLKMNTVDIGETTFIVDRLKARRSAKEIMYSPSFYSHTNGYKLRLQVHPGGFSVGTGTHLSVFIVIGYGKYDGILSWPCKCSFEFSIKNQRNGEMFGSMTLSYANTVDDCKFTFNKPVNKYNKGCGYDTFISNSELSSYDGLIVDDSVIVKCTVSLLK